MRIFSVTNREKEVLDLMSEGLTTIQIATKLYISHHTVQSHKKNLLKKFEAKNSFQLGIKAVRIGII